MLAGDGIVAELLLRLLFLAVCDSGPMLETQFVVATHVAYAHLMARFI